MSKVRVHITVSADGYVAGPNQSLENDGIESALARARAAAAGKNIVIGRGASVINQFLAWGSSTTSSCTSSRWYSGAARASSTGSAPTSSSSKFGRSKRPESLT